MDLLIIHPNDMKSVYGDTLSYVACEPPYWAGVAASYCRNQGYDVGMLDAEAENLSYNEVKERIALCSPLLIGIFVTGTNLSASTQKMQGADLTCEIIKKNFPEIPVFYWGLHPSALPERTLKENMADYVIKGEGFAAIAGLIELSRKGALFSQKNQSEAEAFCVLGGGGLLPEFCWRNIPCRRKCFAGHKGYSDACLGFVADGKIYAA